MTEHMDPVQQHELAFFDKIMSSGKQAAELTDKKDEGTHLKYPRSNEKGNGGGRGKGNDWKPAPSSKSHSSHDGHANQDWQSWGWSKDGSDSKSGDRIAALEQQVSLLSRMASRQEGGLNMLCAEVSFVIHAKIGRESSIVGSLYRVQAMKKNQPEKLDKPMRPTLILCLFKEI